VAARDDVVGAREESERVGERSVEIEDGELVWLVHAPRSVVEAAAPARGE